MDAITAGRHPMIFSDNVPIEHEIALKEAASAAGVLVMGPDCGTAVVGGHPIAIRGVFRVLVRDGLIARDELVPHPRRAEEELAVGIGAAE